MSALAASDASFDQMNAGFKYLADQLVSVVQGEAATASLPAPAGRSLPTGA